MGACSCSLAGTDACKYCRNGSTNYYSNYVYDYPSITKEQLDSITRKEDEWEIPPFMLKGDSDDS